MSKKLCPSCNFYYLKGGALDALSRKDNKTYICSRCAQREALEEFVSFMEKEKNSKK